MKKNDDRIAIYSRKSKFTGKGESIGNQIELCKEYIRTHYGDASIDNTVIYEDEGFSGGNLNRPDFKKMMNAAKNHRFKAIIVYRLDRISRNISDFAGLIEELSRLDIAFISIKEQFDTSSPMGRAMMYIASVFSQLERETIAERIRDNMHELAKTGRWLGGVTPTGYTSESIKNVTIDGKAKKSCNLKLIPEESEIVKTIFDLYIETDSQSLTEAELMQRGIKTKNDKYFSRFSIKAILQNPVYAVADEDTYNYFKKMDTDLFSDKKDFDGIHGIMTYNRTKQEKGKTTVYLPPTEWIVSVGRHPGIISGKDWVRVQESLKRNKTKSYHKPRSNEALLSGLLYCSCGSRMYPKLSRHETPDKKRSYTYVCKMKERSRRSICDQINVDGFFLDTAIIAQIKLLEEDKVTLVEQLEQSRKFITDNPTTIHNQLDNLLKEKMTLEQKINSLVDTLSDISGSSAKIPVTKRIEELSAECMEIVSHIQKLENETFMHTLSTMEFDSLLQFLSVFESCIHEMTVEQKRTAMRAILQKVTWDSENAHVFLFGAHDNENASM